jgi:hypothetical protein
VKNSNKIRLNFYPLKTQEFKFKVWRKLYDDQRKKHPELLVMELPVCSKNKQERKKYEISFEPISSEDFEEFECSSFDNWKLTKNYLFFLLLEKVKRSGKFNDDEFICSQPQKSFRKRIWFVLQTHNEGKETVWLEPYYLEISREFGFLVDFEFRKEESQKNTETVSLMKI